MRQTRYVFSFMLILDLGHGYVLLVQAKNLLK